MLKARIKPSIVSFRRITRKDCVWNIMIDMSPMGHVDLSDNFNLIFAPSS
jgi:hypothetical protein